MRMAVRMPAAKTIANKTGREVRRAVGIVGAALRVTVGSCTIRLDEYDVAEDGGEEDAGGVHDSK